MGDGLHSGRCWGDGTAAPMMGEIGQARAWCRGIEVGGASAVVVRARAVVLAANVMVRQEAGER